MQEKNIYILPDLPYAYDGLEPQMSAEQLTVHHAKHHNAYVAGANVLFGKLDEAKTGSAAIDEKALAKALSFQIGGHILHSLFWRNLAPGGKAQKEPAADLERAIADNFGSFESFRKRFTDLALGVEGSGWAILAFCRETRRLLLMQIEKHNQNVYPAFPILLVLDMFEHAYYLDYKNEKAKYVESFWQILDWTEVGRRYDAVI